MLNESCQFYRLDYKSGRIWDSEKKEYINGYWLAYCSLYNKWESGWRSRDLCEYKCPGYEREPEYYDFE